MLLGRDRDYSAPANHAVVTACICAAEPGGPAFTVHIDEARLKGLLESRLMSTAKPSWPSPQSYSGVSPPGRMSRMPISTRHRAPLSNSTAYGQGSTPCWTVGKYSVARGNRRSSLSHGLSRHSIDVGGADQQISALAELGLQPYTFAVTAACEVNSQSKGTSAFELDTSWNPLAG